MSSSSDYNIFKSDFMVRKTLPFFHSILELGDDARLRSTNMFGQPIKCFTCGCPFHINKDCIKYNKKTKSA